MNSILIGLVLLAADATPCLQHYGPNGRWGWQIIDGKKCWFELRKNERRGRDRDRNDLFWESEQYPMMQKQWELEGRWPK